MGFFNTDSNDSGQVKFNVSSLWWIFFVIAIPLTGLTLGSMALMSSRAKRRAERLEARPVEKGSMGGSSV